MVGVVYKILLPHKMEKNLCKKGEHCLKSFEISQYLSLRKILGISVDLQKLTQKNTIKRPTTFNVFNKKNASKVENNKNQKSEKSKSL